MAQDAAKAADAVNVSRAAAVEAAEDARAVSLRDDLKAARQRVSDAQKALKALEKEAQDAK
jgi:hypothetical protein